MAKLNVQWLYSLRIERDGDDVLIRMHQDDAERFAAQVASIVERSTMRKGYLRQLIEYEWPWARMGFILPDSVVEPNFTYFDTKKIDEVVELRKQGKPIIPEPVTRRSISSPL